MDRGCIPEPRIHIEGIKSGEVYINERTITIDEEAANKYTMELNGKPIQNGHKVSKNGPYTLEVNAKRWWNEQTESIQFEIDNIPPEKPSFKEEIKDVYFKQATFKLNKERDVNYTIMMDGKPYDIEKPVTKKGKHILSIKAVKDNGLFAQNEVKFEIDNRTYSRDTIETFKGFIFHNEDRPEKDPKILKWNKTVSVYVYGKPTSTDLQVLKSYLNNLSEILPIDLIYTGNNFSVKADYSIPIIFVPTHQFKDYGLKEKLINGTNKIVGYTMPTKDSEEGLLRSNVLIGTDTSQQVRKTTILHELVHSLGLYGHFKENEKSILYPFTNNMVTDLGDIDKEIIELLYRPDILHGMDESDVDKVLAPRIKE
ncbi:DUF2927 domain-containing protein [Pseudalkalibacillus caeni]|uniref:DUF2927 domain-containing protein n=1 Tax=Exobacillus caeni TaxID=2574798 RepID=UPI0014857B51|nr:DUF2927 domain-containing protein [Pseudalkalibacillus caeni]